MRCPFCNALDSYVVDSRPCYDGKGIRRRRDCHECGKKFTTYETVKDENVSKQGKNKIQNKESKKEKPSKDKESKKEKPSKDIYEELKRDHDYPVDDYTETIKM